MDARDLGAWSIPKPQFEPGESTLEVAKRECTEEIGRAIAGTLVPLRPVKQAGGKVVHAFAVEADCDPAVVKRNIFCLEWSPRYVISRGGPGQVARAR
jgi:predicted NUDIX family NTP pyrophosphohydrolase